MKTVFVVYEIYDSPYRTTEDSSKAVDRIFLSKTKAEEYVEAEEERVKKDGVRGYYYEIDEAPFDDSL